MSWFSDALGSLTGAKSAEEKLDLSENTLKKYYKNAIANNTGVKTQLSQLYENSSSALSPYTELGEQSADLMSKVLENPFEFNYNGLSTTGKYELNESTKALNRALAARGLLGGGTAATASGDLTSKVMASDATSEYQRQLQTYQTNYSSILNALGIGQNAANVQVGLNSTYGNQLQTNANSQSSLQTGLASALSGVYGDEAAGALSTSTLNALGSVIEMYKDFNQGNLYANQAGSPFAGLGSSGSSSSGEGLSAAYAAMAA